jgi:hypothetical protein
LRLRIYHSRDTKSIIKNTPINIPANTPDDILVLLFLSAKYPINPCAVEVGQDVVHGIVDVIDGRCGVSSFGRAILRR